MDFVSDFTCWFFNFPFSIDAGYEQALQLLAQMAGENRTFEQLLEEHFTVYNVEPELTVRSAFIVSYLFKIGRIKKYYHLEYTVLKLNWF